MWNWWTVEVMDPLGEKPWMLRVPAKAEADALARLWRFGMITGKPQPWRFRPDPELAKDLEAIEERCREINEPRTCLMSAKGRVWQVVRGSHVLLDDLLAVMDLEAEPTDRHFLLQAFVDRKRFPEFEASDDTKMWACWQWLAEWPVFCERWLRKDHTGECECIPGVYPPTALAGLLLERGDSRAAWMEKVAEKIDRMGHQTNPPRLRLW